MKAHNDTKTAELLPNFDLAGEVPPQPNKAAERAKRFRERHGVTPMTVNIKSETLVAFNDWFAKNAKGRSKGEVIAHLIQTQLLRKR